MSEGNGSPQTRYVNAYVERGQLVLFQRTRSGVKSSRRRAENSCFVEHRTLTRSARLELGRSPAVVGVKREGDWTRILWSDRDSCKHGSQWLQSEARIQTYEAGVHPIRRFMVDSASAIQKPRRTYLDIETCGRVPFSRKEEMRILSWATVDGRTGDVQKRLLRRDTNRSERRLLIDLWNTLATYDQVLAWNGARFDFPVIRARLARQDIEVDWRRILWLDHMELFERMNTMAAESGDEKQSMALEAIAQAVLGEGKIPFDSSKTWEAWSNDKPCSSGKCLECRPCLLKYNIHDAVLMRKLELKTGYVELLQTLCEACTVFGDSYGTNPTVQVESFMMNLAREEQHKFKSRLVLTGSEPFEGAYVLHPQEKGILKHVHVADFASLYPTIIRSWNMSPETRDPDATGPSSAHAWSPLTNVGFKTDVEGLLAKAVRHLVEMRQVWKKRQQAAGPGTPKAKEAERRSTAYKIAANQCFGVVGSPLSRLFDRDTAEAITQCGAWLIKETIAAAEKRGMRAIYGDTDSLFVTGCTKDEFERFVKWCNTKLYPRLMKEVGCKENHILLDYEKEFKRIVFSTAKKYCGWFAHYKGEPPKPDSKPEVKGLEFKRGDSVKLARDLQEQIVLMLTREGIDDPSAYRQVVGEWSTRMLEGPITLEDVVISKRLGKALGQYAVRMKNDGTPAAQLPHIEIAKRMAERGEDVGEGAKIDYFVLDGSSSPKVCKPAREWDGTCDRHELWDGLVAPPSLRVLEAAFPGEDWRPWKRTRPKKPRAKRKGKAAEKGAQAA